MGQQNYRPVQASYDFDLSEYQLMAQLPEYNLWRNVEDPFTQPLIEEYKGVLQSERELEHEREIFQFRRNVVYVVSGLQLRYEKVNEMCAQYYTRSLFLEKIYLRLSDLSDLSLEDSLHMMVASLAGFKKLYDRFGFFRVTEQMIGINVRYIVKVWMSENFAAARPDFPACSTQAEGTEKNMASMVIGLIWNCTDKKAAARLAESPLEYIVAAYRRHPRQNEYGIKQIGFSLFEYATQHKIKCSLDMASTARLIQQLKHSPKDPTQTTKPPNTRKECLLQSSKSVDCKPRKDYISSINSHNQLAARSPVSHPLPKSQNVSPPKLHFRSDAALSISRPLTSRPTQQVPIAIANTPQFDNMPSKTNSPNFRPESPRPRLISPKRSNYCPGVIYSQLNSETSLLTGLREGENLTPTVSEMRLPRPPFSSSNNVNTIIPQNTKLEFSRNENNPAQSRMKSPLGSQFFREAQHITPLRFRENPAVLYSRPQTDRALFPAQQSPRKQFQVIDSTVDSHNRQDQPQTEMVESLYALLKRLDESDDRTDDRTSNH